MGFPTVSKKEVYLTDDKNAPLMNKKDSRTKDLTRARLQTPSELREDKPMTLEQKTEEFLKRKQEMLKRA